LAAEKHRWKNLGGQWAKSLKNNKKKVVRGTTHGGREVIEKKALILGKTQESKLNEGERNTSGRKWSSTWKRGFGQLSTSPRIIEISGGKSSTKK